VKDCHQLCCLPSH